MIAQNKKTRAIGTKSELNPLATMKVGDGATTLIFATNKDGDTVGVFDSSMATEAVNFAWRNGLMLEDHNGIVEPGEFPGYREPEWVRQYTEDTTTDEDVFLSSLVGSRSEYAVSWANQHTKAELVRLLQLRDGEKADTSWVLSLPEQPRTENQLQFLSCYKQHLEKQVRAYPQAYNWPAEKTPEVVIKMAAAFDRRSAHLDTPAIKLTCKDLGIKSTQKAVFGFWHGNTEGK